MRIVFLTEYNDEIPTDDKELNKDTVDEDDYVVPRGRWRRYRRRRRR